MNLNINEFTEKKAVSIEDIPKEQLKFFKGEVKKWVELNKEISEYDKKSRELKKKKKELEPYLTKFITDYNIEHLNTDIGKVRCCERNSKKGLNKHNIRENLGFILSDQSVIDQAMEKILNNREVKTTYKLAITKK
tara:strand:- start:957 stop:1364 length:408 start_codon:yes stop_codon:yes gene_type:complete